MKTRFRAVVLFLLLATAISQAQTIDLRLSIKIIRNPYTGARPTDVTDQLLYTSIANANEWMASYGRGYRYRITEIVEVGGPSQGGTNGPSWWYYVANTLGKDVRDPPYWSQFQSATKSSSLYQMRTDAVNVFIYLPKVSGGGGGFPVPPGEVADTAGVGFVNTGPWWVVHELGHFFGLSHTHGGCGGCGDNGGCFTSPFNSYAVGDDNVADTLPEAAGDKCFTVIDLLTRANFNKYFTNCTPGERTFAENTFYNVMSYHDPSNKDVTQTRMTELQADLLADTASKTTAEGGRRAMSSGRTIFISTSGADMLSGRSTGPLRTVAKGHATSAPGDILLLRPGSYDEKLTLNKPLTLRAPRTGWVTIGKP